MPYSALLGVCVAPRSQGEAAILLEKSATGTIGAPYPFHIEPLTESSVFSFDPTIKALVTDLKNGVDRRMIAARFHATIAEGVVQTATSIAQVEKLDRVVLAGGVFYNKLVLLQVTAGLLNHGLKVYTSQSIPRGDAGIAVGQAVIALATMQERK